jgi:hypothetical protein
MSLDQPIILMDNYVDMGDVEQEEASEAGSMGPSRINSELGPPPSLSQAGATPVSR